MTEKIGLVIAEIMERDEFDKSTRAKLVAFLCTIANLADDAGYENDAAVELLVEMIKKVR